MKKISTMNRFYGVLTVSLLILIGIWGCRKESLVYNTTGDVNMTSYLAKNPDFSLFKQIIHQNLILHKPQRVFIFFNAISRYHGQKD